MRPRIYISGPITKENRTQNFATAANMQTALINSGFATMNPMLSMMHPDAWTIAHRAWLENDLPWVAVADVVLRLPGESSGADEETAYAKSLGIPVITNYAALLDWKYKWDAAQPKTVANGT